MPEKKTWEGYIVHNWKENTLRTRKTKPDDSPYEVVREFEHSVIVPNIQPEKLADELELPKEKVEEALGEIELRDGDENRDPKRFLLQHRDLDEFKEEVVKVAKEAGETREKMEFLKDVLAAEVRNWNRDERVEVLMANIQDLQSEVEA